MSPLVWFAPATQTGPARLSVGMGVVAVPVPAGTRTEAASEPAATKPNMMAFMRSLSTRVPSVHQQACRISPVEDQWPPGACHGGLLRQPKRPPHDAVKVWTNEISASTLF